MIKTGKRVRHLRKFSEEFKLKVVADYESGKFGIRELEKMYQISNVNIYNWVYKYSKYNNKSIQIVEMKDSQSKYMTDLEKKVKELERAVGQKQMQIDYLERMITIAGEEYSIDIKKNSNTPQFGGSKNIKKK